MDGSDVDRDLGKIALGMRWKARNRSGESDMREDLTEGMMGYARKSGKMKWQDRWIMGRLWEMEFELA